MSVKAKYQPVLDLGAELNIQGGDVQEMDGKLSITGKANTQYEKDLIWNKIKEAGGDTPSDIEANISVAETAYYHKHEVKSGESLSKIAKQYYNDPMKYKEIFSANTDQLKNPDLIQPGQVLTIPNI